MSRPGVKNTSPRYGWIAVAFVLTTVTAYQLGRRRGPESAEVRDDEGVGVEAEPEPGEPEPTSGDSPESPGSAELAPAADAGPPGYIIVPEPPPRPPREVLIVGKRPALEAEEPAEAEPEPPPVVAREPAAPPPAPPAPPIPEVTHSAFDDEDRIDRHPVPDRGALTRSRFDDEAHIDRHPVP
jgi:hypothetical protein